MPLAMLLTVTVLGVGGPPGVPPARLPNTAITLSHRGHQLARSEDGRLRARVDPGVYVLVAQIRDEPGKPPNLCEARSVVVKRRHGSMAVTLRCSIK